MHTPDTIDTMRVWAGVIAGGLLGVLIVLVGFSMLQTQPQPTAQETASIDSAGGASGASNPVVNVAAQKGDGLPPAPIVGRYPPDFTLKTLEGQTVKLSDLRGKPVWVNFWATWCPPCRAEMPEMQQRYAKLKSKGLNIVGINVAEDPDRVKQFVTNGNFEWTFVLDSSSSVSQQYFISGLPTHLFVGKDGIIKAVQVGGLPGSMMDSYLDTIVNQ